MISAEGGARAFGQMPSEDDPRRGLNKAGGEEGSPIVIPVVGMKNAGTGNSKESGKAQNLVRTKTREFMEGEFGGFR